MRPPAGGTTAREETLTMRPRRAARMAGRTARQPMTAEVRLRAIMRRHYASEVGARAPPAEPHHVEPLVAGEDVGDDRGEGALVGGEIDLGTVQAAELFLFRAPPEAL